MTGAFYCFRDGVTGGEIDRGGAKLTGAGAK